MRLNELTNEAIDPGHKAAIKGMHRLSGDQYYGMYKTMNDVAGHDGKKQTAPSGGTDDEVSDKPFAYAYTDEEEKMLKAVDPKAERITSSKSEELDEATFDNKDAYQRDYDFSQQGFTRPQGHRDDERHDLDVARPLIYGLKINGKIWQKDGNTVTFFTKERALAARNSILAKRPELEVGLVQRPQD